MGMPRTRTELEAAFADNHTRQITAGDIRDLLSSLRLLAEAEYIHHQTVPAHHWDIHHNLGGRPAITVYTDEGNEVPMGITHINDNYAVLDVNITCQITGKAICQL